MNWASRMEDKEIREMAQSNHLRVQATPWPSGSGGVEGVSSPQSPEKVKRPMNAFMIWSSRERSRIRQNHPGIHNSVVSSMLGERWKFLPEPEKKFYFKQAELLRAKHKRDHPNYKYQPDKFRKRAKLGGGMEVGSFSSFFPSHPDPRHQTPSSLSFPTSLPSHPFPHQEVRAGVPAMINPLHFPPTREAPERSQQSHSRAPPSTYRQDMARASNSSLYSAKGIIRCTVRNCGNESGRLEVSQGLRFARFPRNLRLRGVWCRLTGLFLEDSFVKEPYVCADHFEVQSSQLSTGNPESVVVEGLEFPTLGLPIPDSYIVDIISGSWAVDLAQKGPFSQSRSLNMSQIQDISHSDPDPPSRDRSPERLQEDPEQALTARTSHSPSPDNSSGMRYPQSESATRISVEDGEKL